MSWNGKLPDIKAEFVPSHAIAAWGVPGVAFILMLIGMQQNSLLMVAGSIFLLLATAPLTRATWDMRPAYVDGLMVLAALISAICFFFQRDEMLWVIALFPMMYVLGIPAMRLSRKIWILRHPEMQPKPEGKSEAKAEPDVPLSEAEALAARMHEDVNGRKPQSFNENEALG